MKPVPGKDEFSEKDNPVHMMMAREVRKRLDVSLLRLKLRTRAIVFWRFGIFGPPKTFREIAKELGITPGRVGQILNEALRDLRNSRPLKWYGDISDHTLEAVSGVDAPQMTLFTPPDKTTGKCVFPERLTNIEDYMRIRDATEKAMNEL